MGNLLISIHREAFNRAGGTGWQDAFGTVNVANADFHKVGLSAGSKFEYLGNEYQVVRARSALAAGDLVKSYTGAAGRIGNIASATKAVLTTDDTFVAHDLIGGIVYINAGTGIGQMRRILANDDAAGASTITVAERDASLPNVLAVDTAEAFDTAPDATSDYVAYCNWEVTQTAGITDYVVGVSLGTVTSGYWTIIQTKGPALIKGAGNTDAIAHGLPVVPSATAGTGKGQTTAGITAVEAARVFAEGLSGFVAASGLAFVRLFGLYSLR